MVELRWVRSVGTGALADELQYRVQQPIVGATGALTPGPWSEWKPVPVLLRDDPNRHLNPPTPGT